MWRIAREQDHQPGLRLEQTVRRRKKTLAAPGTDRKDGWSCLPRRGSDPTIDVINPRPGCSRMGVHLVKIASPIDVDPSTENPIFSLRGPGKFNVEAACRFLDHVVHITDQPPTGTSAKFRHPGIRMPATDIGRVRPGMPPLILQNASRNCGFSSVPSAQLYDDRNGVAKRFRNLPFPILASQAPRVARRLAGLHPGTG
jgi:hypothetical protein